MEGLINCHGAAPQVLGQAVDFDPGSVGGLDEFAGAGGEFLQADFQGAALGGEVVGEVFDGLPEQFDEFGGEAEAISGAVAPEGEDFQAGHAKSPAAEGVGGHGRVELAPEDQGHLLHDFAGFFLAEEEGAHEDAQGGLLFHKEAEERFVLGAVRRVHGDRQAEPVPNCSARRIVLPVLFAVGGSYERAFQDHLLHLAETKSEASQVVPSAWDRVISQEAALGPAEGARLAGRQAAVKAALSMARAADGRATVESLCLTCHAIADRGVGFPPPLDGASRRDLDGLIAAIVAPNQAAEHVFLLYQIEKKDGTLVEGFKRSEDVKETNLAADGRGGNSGADCGHQGGEISAGALHDARSHGGDDVGTSGRGAGVFEDGELKARGAVEGGFGARGRFCG